MSTPVSMLEKRRIEAEILAEVYDVVKQRQGQEEAEAVIREAVAHSAIAQGKSFRQEYDHEPNLKDFATHLHHWEKGDALERKVLRSEADRLDYDIVRCEYANMYREMGLGHIGHLLSCNRDSSFCIGYNPEMELTRTQTIMEGAAFCDFRYRMKGRKKD